MRAVYIVDNAKIAKVLVDPMRRAILDLLRQKPMTQAGLAKESSTSFSDQNSPQILEIEGLQQYIFRIEKEHKDDKLKLMIEDRINRFNLEFDKPRKVDDTDDSDKLIAQGVKGMLSKGPDLRMEIVPTSENKYAIRIRASKGKKKSVFNDDIMISSTEAEKLKRYIKDNFSK
jgi:hypothetical protein